MAEPVRLRRELLRFDLGDGGLEILDIVMEQVHTFSAEDATALRGLDAGGEVSEALGVRLARALLLEGPGAAALREGCRHGRRRSMMPPPELDVARGRWELAEQLPDIIAPAWRDPERWRRLAEDRLAGRSLLRLDGLITPDAAHALREQVAALPFQEYWTDYVRGEGFDVTDELDAFVAPFRTGTLRTLLSHVMDQDLPQRMFLRTWRLRQGDGIVVHKDGLHYVTTFSIGLCPDWCAAYGGNIVFGQPTPGGIDVVERWVPHLGDMLLFRPTSDGWHAVEPVTQGTRMTLTGQYVGPEYAA